MAWLHTNQQFTILDQQFLLQWLDQHVCKLIMSINSINFDLETNIYACGVWPHFKKFTKFYSTRAILKAMMININCVTIYINIKLFLSYVAIIIRKISSLSDRAIYSTFVVLRISYVWSLEAQIIGEFVYVVIHPDYELAVAGSSSA